MKRLFTFSLLLLAGLLQAQAWATMPLTPDERAYLANRGPVNVCVDPDIMPYEKIDPSGRHIGIAADYLALFQRGTGLRFQLVPSRSWSESERFARARKCDVLSLLNQSSERSQYLKPG